MSHNVNYDSGSYYSHNRDNPYSIIRNDSLDMRQLPLLHEEIKVQTTSEGEVDNTTMIMSFIGVGAFFIEILLLIYYFLNGGSRSASASENISESLKNNPSANIINFYRSVVFIIIGYLHIYYEKINLEEPKYFSRLDFYNLVNRALTESLVYMFFVLSVKYLNLTNFAFYFCTFILFTILFGKIPFGLGIQFTKISEYTYIISALLLILINIISDPSNIQTSSSNTFGLVYFLLFSLSYVLFKYFESKVTNSRCDYLNFICTGIVSLILSPISIALEKADNLISFKMTVLIIFLSICGFYINLLFIKISDKISEKCENYLNYKMSKLTFGILPLLALIGNSFLGISNNITDYIVGFGFIVLFLVKYLYPTNTYI